MRFSAASRLKTASEFALVRAGGVTFPGRFIVLSVLKLEQNDPWRCGLITSRKVGGAVQRNKIRRRLREIVRATPLRSGYWIVTIARWRAGEASLVELQDDWRRSAKRAGILLQGIKQEGAS
ncbi:MAG: ribonuclease protein component [Verrucomicrobiota bacterium]|jgi:ribonuclease P protein component